MLGLEAGGLEFVAGGVLLVDADGNRLGLRAVGRVLPPLDGGHDGGSH